MKLVYILLAVILVRNILLYKTYLSVPFIEIKRRARLGNKKARALYKVAGYGELFYVREWLFGVAIGSALVIWSARTAWWLAAAVTVALAWLIVWIKVSVDGWAGGLAAFFAPFDAWLLLVLKPVLNPFVRWAPRQDGAPTGLYEKKDLLEFLNRQTKQPDNRIDEKDLHAAFNALSFSDKKVISIMTPRAKIKFVKASETVGPMLMDELHKTGFSRFPVVKDNTKTTSLKIIGSLYLKDIIGDQAGGKVKEFVRKGVGYLNEDADLGQALNEFLESDQLMLVIVNNFDETVGLLSLEDVLAQLIGRFSAPTVAK